MTTTEAAVPPCPNCGAKWWEARGRDKAFCRGCGYEVRR